MKDFYLKLLSDSSLNMFPNNKQSEFTVRLDHQIHIEEERWEMVLVEFATPSEVLNTTKENKFFFLKFHDERILNRIGMENVTEMCSNDIACDKYKLFIPIGNYVSPEYLAEEMQSSVDNFEKGVLKRANAHIIISYDAVSQLMKISAQNEEQVRLLFPKQIGQILGLGRLESRKTGLSPLSPPPPPQFFNSYRSKAALLLWFLTVTSSCCPYLYFGSAIMLVTYFSKF